MIEIHLTPELEAKLARLADQQGRKREALAEEAIERFVNFDEWFIQEVEEAWRLRTGATLLNMKK